MDVNRLFGINEEITDSYSIVESGVVIDDNGIGIRTGTPCLLISTKPKIDSMGRALRVHRLALFPMPYHSGVSPRQIFDISPGNGGPIVKSRGTTDFLERIKSLETKRFDLNKLDNLLTHVRTTGPVSLIITENNGNLKPDVIALFKALQKKFKFAATLHRNHNEPKNLIAGDSVVCSITISDIKETLPVFDPRQSSGVVVNMTILYTEQSNKKRKLALVMDGTTVFSGFKENFIKINGEPTQIGLTSINNIISKFKEDSTFSLVGDAKSKSRKEEKREVREKKRASKKKKIAKYGDIGTDTILDVLNRSTKDYPEPVQVAPMAVPPAGVVYHGTSS